MNNYMPLSGWFLGFSSFLLEEILETLVFEALVIRNDIIVSTVVTQECKFHWAGDVLQNGFKLQFV